MTLNDILLVTGGTLLCGNKDVVINNFSINSNDVKENSLFLAINHGNEYYLDAFNNDFEAVIIDNPKVVKKLTKNIILVNDTVKAMEAIAKRKLLCSKASVIGVTGSVGKTTTKDIIYSVLKEKYNVLKTMENYNGKIGVPLTILNLKDEDILVLEMGIDDINGFTNFSKYVKLDLAVITSIGYSHIEKFKNQESILEAKLKITSCLKNTGILLLNDNDPLLHIINMNKVNILKYGKNIYKISDVEINEKLNFKINNLNLSVPYTGTSYISNYLVAYIIGKYYGINDCLIKQGLENASLSNDRMNIERYKNINFINDYYNASYESVKNALEVLGNFNTRKIAVIGDVLELGEYSREIHQKIGYEVINNHIDKLVTVGDNSLITAKYVKNNSNIKTIALTDIEEALPAILCLLNDNDTILLKASNKMNFKTLTKKIKNNL